jgi:dienelactone hydrolase
MAAMKRVLLLAAVIVAGIAALGLTSCAPTSGRYVDRIFETTTKTTHQYKQTTNLVTGAPQNLALDVYQPTGDTLEARPVIVWIHGGGFFTGNRGAMGDVAAEWAQRGYVTLSISYRLDSGNKCQQVQDGTITDPVQEQIERDRCARVITAAKDDAFSAIEWIRANAATYRVDPERVAVAGSSAGAVTALNVAQWGNPGGGPVPANRKVSAALAMSGCQYDPAMIDANDAPIGMIASGGDISVPYECSTETIASAKALGTKTVANYWPEESLHAKDLYRAHQVDVDKAWTAFLYNQLQLTQPPA